MIRDRFPGLVIGGPLDGQLHEGNSPSFQIVENLPMPHFVDPKASHVNNASVRVITYSYLPTVAGVHFWIADIETPETVLTKLAVAYIKVRTLDL
jgi:hypothetical protein